MKRLMSFSGRSRRLLTTVLVTLVGFAATAQAGPIVTTPFEARAPFDYSSAGFGAMNGTIVRLTLNYDQGSILPLQCCGVEGTTSPQSMTVEIFDIATGAFKGSATASRNWYVADFGSEWLVGSRGPSFVIGGQVFGYSAAASAPFSGALAGLNLAGSSSDFAIMIPKSSVSSGRVLTNGFPNLTNTVRGQISLSNANTSIGIALFSPSSLGQNTDQDGDGVQDGARQLPVRAERLADEHRRRRPGRRV